MRHLHVTALAAALALLAACHAGPVVTPLRAAVTSDTLSLADRTTIVEGIDGLVRSGFAHWQGLGAQSYDSMVTHFRARAARSASRLEFDLATFEFMAGLRNGHTSFHDEWLAAERGHPRWFALLSTAEGWVVRWSRVDGLSRGDVVTAIDGVPTESLYARHAPYVAASGERTRRRIWTSYDVLFPAVTTLTTGEGRTIVVDRAEAGSVSSTPSIVPPHRWLVRDSIAYLRIPAFAPAAWQDSALTILKREYARAPALVLDVRDNAGGSTPSALMRHLMNAAPGRPLIIESTTLGRSPFRFLQWMRPRSGGGGYGGKLVILADGGCASACEDLVAPFADNHRATVVGDTTWGSSGQPRFLVFGNGMSLRVGARRYRLASGEPFEGMGIAPHVVVPVSREAMRAGADPPLARGLAEARALLGRP